jgi:hypothetical protein
MALTETAPYAPVSGITAVLEKYRETGLGGGPITTSHVQRLSMGQEVARRVVLSLRQLELIDDDDNPLPALITFKKASSSEYKQILAAHLLDVYSAVFAITGQDLSGKSVAQLEDAFRDFKPDSLRRRMVTCFVGLCEYVGIVEASPKSKPTGGSAPRHRPVTRTPQRKPEVPPPPPPYVPPAGGSTTATLESGGTVTLSVSVSLVDLSTTDREFVFGLIDKVKGYGNRPALGTGSPTDGADGGSD